MSKLLAIRIKIAWRIMYMHKSAILCYGNYLEVSPLNNEFRLSALQIQFSILKLTSAAAVAAAAVCEHVQNR